MRTMQHASHAHSCSSCKRCEQRNDAAPMHTHSYGEPSTDDRSTALHVADCYVHRKIINAISYDDTICYVAERYNRRCDAALHEHKRQTTPSRRPKATRSHRRRLTATQHNAIRCARDRQLQGQRPSCTESHRSRPRWGGGGLPPPRRGGRPRPCPTISPRCAGELSIMTDGYVADGDDRAPDVADSHDVARGDDRPRWLDYVALDDIVFAPRNPKGHDIGGIGGSIDTHGVGELPLLDERTGRLVAGHGRVETLRAKRAAGESAPDGLTVRADGSWLVPVIRGWRSASDSAAESYLIGSNEWVARGGWSDERQLADMLIELSRVDAALLAATGYDQPELDALLSALDAEATNGDGPTFTPGDDGTRLDRKSVTDCPKCGHTFTPTTRTIEDGDPGDSGGE